MTDWHGNFCAGNEAYADTFDPDYDSKSPPAPAQLQHVKYVKMLRIVNEPDIVPKVTINLIVFLLLLHAFPADARCVCRHAADKSASILLLDGHARSKQDPIVAQ